MSGPCVAPGSSPGAGHRRSSSHQLRGERVVYAVLHQQTVHAHTGLSRVPILGGYGALNGRIEIRVVEDDKRGVAAKLEGDLLHRRGALRHQELAHRGRPGEREFAHGWIRRQLTANLRRRAGHHIEHAVRNASARTQVRQRERRERRLRRGLEDHRAPGGNGRPDLARNHRQREVPGRDARHHAYRLLEDHNARVAVRCRDRVAIDALSLLAEPLQKSSGVGHFPARLGERLPLLDGHEPGEILLVLPHQVEPGAQDRGPLLRGLRAPCHHRARRRLDRQTRLEGAGIGHRADDFAGGGVVDRNRGTRASGHPLGVDVAGLTEEIGVGEGAHGRREEWSGRQDSNLRHPAPKAGALPGCATPRPV